MRGVTFRVQRDCPCCGVRFRVRIDRGGKAVGADPPPLPFCSRRCRLIDLGLWLEEAYTISEPLDRREAAED